MCQTEGFDSDIIGRGEKSGVEIALATIRRLDLLVGSELRPVKHVLDNRLGERIDFWVRSCRGMKRGMSEKDE